jgi:hypothetical protein
MIVRAGTGLKRCSTCNHTSWTQCEFYSRSNLLNRPGLARSFEVTWLC